MKITSLFLSLLIAIHAGSPLLAEGAWESIKSFGSALTPQTQRQKILTYGGGVTIGLGALLFAARPLIKKALLAKKKKGGETHTE